MRSLMFGLFLGHFKRLFNGRILIGSFGRRSPYKFISLGSFGLVDTSSLVFFRFTSRVQGAAGFEVLADAKRVLDQVVLFLIQLSVLMSVGRPVKYIQAQLKKKEKQSSRYVELNRCGN
jgi:hypothetical protein